MQALLHHIHLFSLYIYFKGNLSSVPYIVANSK